MYDKLKPHLEAEIESIKEAGLFKKERIIQSLAVYSKNGGLFRAGQLIQSELCISESFLARAKPLIFPSIFKRPKDRNQILRSKPWRYIRNSLSLLIPK